MTALVVAEAVVIVFLAILVAGMLRSHADILRKLHELGAGEEGGAPFQTAAGVTQPGTTSSQAHDIVGATATGGASAIRVKGAAQPTLLAFMSATCSTCHNFWERFDLEEVLRTMGSTRFVIVTKGSEDESPAHIDLLAPQGIPLVMSTQAFVDYGVPGTPYFVMVDGSAGMVTGEGSASDWDKLLDLMGFAGGDVSPGADDRDRAERVDQELADAGILPGDPQLYGEPELSADGEQ
jgi:hypothetical protein